MITSTFKWIFILSFSLLLCLGTLTFLILDTKPLVMQQQELSVDGAKQAKSAAKRLLSAVRSNKHQNELYFSVDEIDGMLALSRRAFDRIQVDSYPRNNQLFIDVSVALNSVPFYINVSTSIESSVHGLKLGEFSVGSLSIAGDTFLSLATWAVEYYLKSDAPEAFIKSIKQVEVEQGGVSLRYDLSTINSLGDTGSTLENLKHLRDQLALFGDVSDVQYYLDRLMEFAKQRKSLDLSDYVSFVISEASQRKVASYSYKKENYAALMALVLYFGHDRFALLVGNLNPYTEIQSFIRAWLQRKVTLNGRVDLQKHFIYSMAFQLFANNQTSDLVGEFKELIDSVDGGSGFSFADLFADRAGVRFADVATNNDDTAKSVQEYIVANKTDINLLPDHIGLPEGISQKDFEKEYRNLNSKAYKEMVEYIDKRLLQSEVYSLATL